jgi:hypothetical protein
MARQVHPNAVQRHFEVPVQWMSILTLLKAGPGCLDKCATQDLFSYWNQDMQPHIQSPGLGF